MSPPVPVPAALTLAELDDLERRCSNDGGPWSVTVEIADPEEIELAVRAVNALPALLAAARQLPAAKKALASIAAALEQLAGKP